MGILLSHRETPTTRKELDMSNFKNEAIKKAAEYVIIELKCSEIEAISKMQTRAAKNKENELLEDLCKYKENLVLEFMKVI